MAAWKRQTIAGASAPECHDRLVRVYLRAPDGPVITTTRLTLRPSEEDDVPVLHRLWTERDPRVPAHRRIDEHGRPTQADLLEGLRGQASDRLGVLTVVLRRTGEAIGYVGLVSGDQGPELAFEVLSAHHGQGLATEAANAHHDVAAPQGE